ncbi:hypothetical protein B4U84_26700 [Westiellopsis prolifica IICB1]|nr:hypothetical protein B4U84_26700 [Westiellopsis prolifica IICB1]
MKTANIKADILVRLRSNLCLWGAPPPYSDFASLHNWSLVGHELVVQYPLNSSSKNFRLVYIA